MKIQDVNCSNAAVWRLTVEGLPRGYKGADDCMHATHEKQFYQVVHEGIQQTAATEY